MDRRYLDRASARVQAPLECGDSSPLFFGRGATLLECGDLSPLFFLSQSDFILAPRAATRYIDLKSPPFRGYIVAGLTTRERLIQHILRLPETLLPQIEQFLQVLGTSDLTTQERRHDEHPASTISIGPRDWPHAPLHRLVDHGTFMITAGTLHKEHIFRGADRLDLLELNLLTNAKRFGWRLEAWAVFSNHYHFVAHALANADELASFIKALHGETAVIINRVDGHPGRKVWHNYRDTELSYEKSYFARLNYVHHNAVKHGLVPVANQYRWCSAAWFERTATPAQVRTIYRFKTDKVKVDDDYEPVAP